MLGTIRKAQKGYVVDVTINGARRKTSCKTKQDALAKQKEFNELFKKKAQRKSPVKLHITLIEAQRLAQQTVWKDLASLKTCIGGSNQIIRFFGPDFLLKDIDATQWNDFREDQLSEDRQPTTVNKKTTYLKGMIGAAITFGHLKEYPVLPPNLKDVKRPKRVFSEEEEAFFIKYWTQCGYIQLVDLFKWSLDMCTRWGESLRVKVKHVNLKTKEVLIHKSKNGEPRTVPMTDRAYQAIKPWVEGKRKNDYVWRDEITYHILRRLIKEVKREMDMEEDKRLTWHCTRHTCATKLAKKGVPLLEIKQFGGWRSIAAVQVYLHTNTMALSRCVEALES
tara:strand:+ start:3289 stop:4296 length:1008 start_codon:yes stop_codon:yes gene_type:complete